MHSSLYGIYIDTSQVQMITAANYTSYTFKVEKDTIVQDTLYNYVITKFSNEDYQQMLLAYPLIPDGDNNNEVTFDVANAKGIVINDPTIQIRSCEEFVEEIWEWVEECVEVNCSAGGGHSPGEETECHGDPDQLPYTTCTGGWVNTGCTGGGGDTNNDDTNGNQGGGGGTDPDPDPDPDEEEEEETTPVAIIPFNNLSRKCKKVSDFLDENAGFKTLLQNLHTDTDENYEVSISKFKNAETIIRDEGEEGDASAEIVRHPSQKYQAYAHTHYETDDTPEGDTLSVLTIDDLFATAQIIEDGDINTGSFVMFLATGKETYYALTIQNKSKFLKFFNHKLNRIVPLDPILFAEWYNAKNKYDSLFKNYYDEDEGLINESNNNTDFDLNYFLNFMKDADLGATLFKTDATFNNFDIKELANDGIVITRPCNQNQRR